VAGTQGPNVTYGVDAILTFFYQVQDLFSRGIPGRTVRLTDNPTRTPDGHPHGYTGGGPSKWSVGENIRVDVRTL